jgi:hypothetical protein
MTCGDEAEAGEGGGEDELGFGVGAEGVFNGGQFGLEDAEEVGEIERVDLGGEAFEGQIVEGFRVMQAEEAAVMTAEVFAFKGDLTAGSAGG